MQEELLAMTHTRIPAVSWFSTIVLLIVIGWLPLHGQQAATTNSTVAPLSVGGSGSANFIPIWTSSSALGNSTIFESGGNVGIGNTSPAGKLDVSGTVFTRGTLNLNRTTSSSVGVIKIGGSPFIHACCPKSAQNTFVGAGAGNFSLDASGTNSSVGANTGVGFNALAQNTTGFNNTAIGDGALSSNTTGDWNTAMGQGALPGGGSVNVAVGYSAGANLNPASGGDNFIGGFAGPGTSSELFNATAIGYAATVSQSNTLILGGTGENSVTVGIGTATPFNDYALDVEATETGINPNPINSGVVVNAAGGNLYLGMTNGVHMFRVDFNGGVHAAGGFQTSGADFAESVAVRGMPSQYRPGDLMEIAKGEHRTLTLSHTPYSTRVAGIYSTKPGVLATPHSINETLDGEIPLAIVGIVPCKVTAENGAVREGDLLVSSSRPGYAMKGTDRHRMLGAVVGKALEPLSMGRGVIQVLVTLQ
jgi:hypothetical protein